MPEKTQSTRKRPNTAAKTPPVPATPPEAPVEPPAESITDLVTAFLEGERAAAASTHDDGMSYVASVRAFIAASPWLGPEHMPAVVSLKRIAESLDHEMSAALAGQFGVTFRDLRAQAPQLADDEDPVERALREREQGSRP